MNQLITFKNDPQSHSCQSGINSEISEYIYQNMRTHEHVHNWVPFFAFRLRNPKPDISCSYSGMTVFGQIQKEISLF